MTDPRNPYAPPAAPVSDRDDRTPTDFGEFIPYGRSVSPGRGAGWIGDAWRVLRGQPGMWAISMILLFVAYIVLSIIPFVGFFVQLLVPFAAAGIAVAADQQRRTGSFELGALTAGFNKAPGALLAVGAVSILAGVIFVVILFMFVGFEVIAALASGREPDPSTFMGLRFVLAFLIGILVMLPVAFATYLAPQLIMLHDQPALTAMKMSAIGCFKNILPGIVFAICGILLVLLSMIPLFLGLLISVPIMVLTNYTVYRDIFVEENP